MNTVLKPCRVPWAVSPSMDGLTLHHLSDDQPHCIVVFGGGRLNAQDRIDSRRIEITFSSGYFARVNVKRDDESIEASGFDVLGKYDGPAHDYLTWLVGRWRETGLCPKSGFYVATASAWLDSVDPRFGLSDLPLRHFVLAGRESYIEILATGYSWREWLWSGGKREDFQDPSDVVGTGQGVE